jgi:hypothetical protein
VRQHERFSVRHRITVVNGFAAIHAHLGRHRCRAHRHQGDWLRVGPLVSAQVEGGSGSFACGVIRRCWRPNKHQTNVASGLSPGNREIARFA